MAKKYKVKKLPNSEYEITHPDGHIQRLAKSSLERSIKEKEQELIENRVNLDYKNELLKEINEID